MACNDAKSYRDELPILGPIRHRLFIKDMMPSLIRGCFVNDRRRAPTGSQFSAFTLRLTLALSLESDLGRLRVRERDTGYPGK